MARICKQYLRGHRFESHHRQFSIIIQVKKSYQIVISNSAQTVLKMPFSTNDTNYTDQKALPDQIFKIPSKPFQKCHFLQFPVLKIAFFQLCIVWKLAFGERHFLKIFNHCAIPVFRDCAAAVHRLSFSLS